MAENLIQDVRYALRMFRKNPTFTIVALLTLALGIGVNVAIFSIVEAVLLRPLPYPDSANLVQLKGYDTKRGVDFDWVSFPNYYDWANENQAFEVMAAYKFDLFNLTAVNEPQALLGLKVSVSMFPLLRAQAWLGRTFTAEEDRPGHDKVAVLSYETWNRIFDANRDLIGRSITLNNQSYAVIGVMPPGFNFPPTIPITSLLPSRKMSLWVPLGLTFNQAERDWNMLGVVARLKPNVTLAQARASMESLAGALEQQYPGPNKNLGVHTVLLLDEVVGGLRPALLVFVGAVWLVLLICCANITNLFLARSAIRQNEFALRATLGATRLRLMRQLLIESLLLALIGGAFACVLARGGNLLLLNFIPENIPRIAEVVIDRKVIEYTIVVSLLSALIFSLAPIVGTSRLDLGQSIKSYESRSTGSAKHSHFRGMIVISEIAFSVTLLVGAGLMFKSFMLLEKVDPGFQPKNVLTIWTVLPETKYREPRQWSNFYQEALERIALIPGVKDDGAINDLPLTGIHGGGPFRIEGEPATALNGGPYADRCVVSVNYFRTMQIALVRGRGFRETDQDNSPSVAIINQRAAHQYWSGEDPIGKRITLDLGSANPTWFEIVGIVTDVRSDGLDVPAKPTIFRPIAQAPAPFLAIVIRTVSEPIAVLSGVRAAIASVDKDQPLFTVRTLEQIYADAVAQRRFNTFLIAVFGTIALPLAMVGIYGVMAFSVSQRAHEIGVRVALGAQPGNVLSLILTQGLKLTITGIAFGLLGATIVAHLLSTLLFEVHSNDPVIFGTISLSVLSVALLAIYIPAQRAMRRDPISVLHHQ